MLDDRTRATHRVSPGFTPRPWLSVPRPRRESRRCHVSPGFTPRPWLSGDDRVLAPHVRGRVSPGFTPRPWLSGDASLRHRFRSTRVAGVHAPALVERCGCVLRLGDRRGVSPGFTPRPWLSVRSPAPHARHARVSPGFTPRPWLSEIDCVMRILSASACRRGSRPGLG